MTVSTAVFPKYWNVDRSEVTYGVELDASPVPLTAILGTYTWIFLHDSHYGARLLTPSRSSTSSVEDEDAGHLTLALPPGSPPSPEHIHGSFSMGALGLRGTLDPGSVRPPSSPSPKWTARIRWHAPPSAHAAPPADSAPSTHAFAFTAARDDAGRPLVQFVWDGGARMGRAYSVVLLGKRAEGGALTPGERARLGVDVDEAEVARAGRTRAARGVLVDSSNAQAGTKRKMHMREQ